jgi:hypothetical protein
MPLRRAIFKAYGVSLLDGLSLFENFSANYCIVKTESPLWTELLARQNLALTHIRVKLLFFELEKYAKIDFANVNKVNNIV